MYSNYNGRSSMSNRAYSEFDDQRETERGSRKAYNEFDERPVRGQRSNDFDDRPIRGQKSNAFDEQPIRGSRVNTFDEDSVRDQRTTSNERYSRQTHSSRSYDREFERPVIDKLEERSTKRSKSPRDTENRFDRPAINEFDERPVRGQRSYGVDERHVRGERSNEYDEMPVRGRRTNDYDERPVKSSKSPRRYDHEFDRKMETEFDERPVRDQRSHDFDKTSSRSSRSPRDYDRGFDRPAINEFDKRPVRGQKSNDFDERPSRTSKSPRNYGREFDRPLINDFDEMSVRGERINEFDERPVRGSRSNDFDRPTRRSDSPRNNDERPFRSSKSPRNRDHEFDRPKGNDFDERPVRGQRTNELYERPSGRSKSPRDTENRFDRPAINEFDERPARGQRSNGFENSPSRISKSPKNHDRELDRPVGNNFDERTIRGQRSNEFDERSSKRSKSPRDNEYRFDRPIVNEYDERPIRGQRSNELEDRPSRVTKSPRDHDRAVDRQRSYEDRPSRESKSPRASDRRIERKGSFEFEDRPARGSVRDSDRSRDTYMLSNNNLYTIHVTTSNMRLAGTDANVYVQLIGAYMVSDKIPLTVSSTPGNMFEAGKVDIFKIKSENVGPILKLRIGHDNKGYGSGWHLKEVLVESQADAQAWLFKCNRWLDKNEEDGKIERELLPVEVDSPRARSRSRSGERKIDEGFDSEISRSGTGRRSWDKSRLEDPFQTPASDQITYKLYVETSELRGSGTDANVYVNIYGHKLSTGKIGLKSSRANLNMFEMGKTDYFEIKGTDVGEIEMLKIGHDNQGLAAAWHLREVVIETPDRGKFIFPCDQWFNRKHGDGKIERDLFPKQRRDSRSPRVASGDRSAYDTDPFDQVPPYNREPLQIEYRISVTTSDIKYAGTDANVYVNLFGRKQETGRIFLKGSKTNINQFEEGKTDHFTIMGKDVGEIEMLQIGHDNKGLGPGWHLKEVEVETPDRRKYMFPCDQWFDKKEGDGKIERDLFRVENLREMSEKSHAVDMNQFIGRLMDYTITVCTSDVVNAGTDANVYVKIYGDARKSGVIGLDKSLSHRNKFEQGNEDRFEVREEFFGDIYKLKIGHDNNGLGPGWHLNEVSISCKELNRKWLFTCNRWLSKDEDDGRIELELQPKVSEVYEPNRTEYVLEVFTGDERRAGTDANVYVTLIGEKGDSSEKALAKSETHLNKFERNHMDRFVMHDRNFGDLYGIKIRHDNSGTMAEWFLDRVEITDKLRKKKYMFICQKWLSLHRDDKKIERILKEQDYKVKRQTNKHQTKNEKDVKKEKRIKYIPCLKEYYVKFYTGIKQDIAGTDMNVYIRLFGDDGESKMCKLNFRDNKTHDRNFERNQIDLFVIKANDDLGTLYAAELKLENCLKSANDLHIEKIQVSYDDYLYEFQYDQQVSLKDSDSRYKQLILLENNAQFF